MIDFITNNYGFIIISLVLIVILILVACKSRDGNGFGIGEYFEDLVDGIGGDSSGGGWDDD